MKNFDNLFNFFNKHQFKLIDKSIPPQPFGNYYYTFSNGHVEFQIVSDRGEESISVRSIINEGWCAPSLINSFLNNGENLHVEFNIDEEERFIIEHFDTIIDMFSDKNYKNFSSKLKDLAIKKNRQKFGDDFFMSK